MRLAFPISIALSLWAGFCRSAMADDEQQPTMVRFEENDKFGFKNESGKVVVEPIYDDARDFSCGLAPVNKGAKRKSPGVILGGRWGYINARGEVVVRLTLTTAREFSDGLALVSDDQGNRYIDTQGNTAIVPGRAWCGDFREGVAPVYDDRSFSHQDWQTKFIDKTGATVFLVDGYAKEFHNGLAVLIKDAADREKSRYGFIDRDGKVVIAPQFAEAQAFSEGLAAVRTSAASAETGNSFGYVNKRGKYVIEPQFNEAQPFRRGVAVVHVGGKIYTAADGPSWWKGGEWRLIDGKGDILKRSKRPLRYEDAQIQEVESSDKLLVFEGTVVSIEISPTIPESKRNHVVTVRVDRVEKGRFNGKTFQFRVHSPVQSGLKIDGKYTVEAKRTKDGYAVDQHQWGKPSTAPPKSKPTETAQSKPTETPKTKPTETPKSKPTVAAQSKSKPTVAVQPKPKPKPKSKPIVAATYTPGRELVITPDPETLAALGLTIEQFDRLKGWRIPAGKDHWNLELEGKKFNLADVADVTERNVEVKPFTAPLLDGREVVVTPDAKQVGRYCITGDAFAEDVRVRLCDPFLSDSTLNSPGKVQVLSDIPVPGGGVPSHFGREHVHISTGEPLETFAKIELRGKPGPQAADLLHMRIVRRRLNEGLDFAKGTSLVKFEERFGQGEKIDGEPPPDVESPEPHTVPDQTYRWKLGKGDLTVRIDRERSRVKSIRATAGVPQPTSSLPDVSRQAAALADAERALLLEFMKKFCDKSTPAERAILTAFFDRSAADLSWTSEERKQLLDGQP